MNIYEYLKFMSLKPLSGRNSHNLIVRYTSMAAKNSRFGIFLPIIDME